MKRLVTFFLVGGLAMLASSVGLTGCASTPAKVPASSSAAQTSPPAQVRNGEGQEACASFLIMLPFALPFLPVALVGMALNPPHKPDIPEKAKTGVPSKS